MIENISLILYGPPNIMKVSPILVQACKDNESLLIQLPHITESTLKHL